MLNKLFAGAISRMLSAYKTSTNCRGVKRTRVRLDQLGPFIGGLTTAHQEEFWKQYHTNGAPHLERFLHKLINLQMCELCRAFVTSPSSKLVCACCMKTKEGRAYTRDKNSEAVRNTWDERYHELLDKQIATSRKRWGTDFPWQNARVQAHKKANYRKRGVGHHFHDPAIHLKQQTSAFKMKHIRVQGKNYLCQGYEPHILRSAVNHYGPDNVLGQYDPRFQPIDIGRQVYRPDFYIVPADTYVEVKSVYTLLAANSLRKNRDKARSCEAGDIRVRWIVGRDEKSFLELPEGWWRWKTSELRAFLTPSC